MANLDEVAELYAEQSVRVRRLVQGAVCAPEALVEDACQVAWSRLVRNRARVRRDTAPGWLIQTAIHEAWKLIHREGRELSLDALGEGSAGETPIVSASALLEDLVEQRARLASVRYLPERQQRLVWLQGIGFSYAEMAAHTGASRRTVERQLLRAKARLTRLDA
jgi:DNA-directed RNA polymerase specialized sigma24 family protein